MAMDAQASARRRQMLGIIIGLLVAGASGVGLYFLVSNNSTNQGGPSGTTSVVVAIAPITPGTKLDSTNVAVKPISTASVPVQGTTTVYTDISLVTGSDHFAAVPIGTNEVITSSLLIPTVPLPRPPFQITDGNVAMAMPVDDQKGIGGWILEGDHIDIIADVTGTNSVRFTLQDIKILRIGSTSQQPAAPAAGQPAAATTTQTPATLIIVEVSRQQAEELNYMLNSKGGSGPQILRYVLRPKNQWGTSPLRPVILPTVPTLPPCPPNATPDQEASVDGNKVTQKCLPQTPTETPVNQQTWNTLFPWQ